jgi:hypothetical protein
VSQQINLYSPIFRKQEKIFSATTMLQAFVLIVVVVAVSFYIVSLQTSVLQMSVTESARQLRSELERLKVYGAGDSPAERAKLLAERKRKLEASLATSAQALAGFDADAVGGAEGYSDVLRALSRASIDGVWLTRIQFAKGKGELSIAGRATRADLVPAYLERLRSEPTLRGREFSRLEVTGAPSVAFTLSSGQGAPVK